MVAVQMAMAELWSRSHGPDPDACMFPVSTLLPRLVLRSVSNRYVPPVPRRPWHARGISPKCVT
jgi:hypothetical protein